MKLGHAIQARHSEHAEHGHEGHEGHDHGGHDHAEAAEEEATQLPFGLLCPPMSFEFTTL